jgi:uncharacterized protein (TIGR02266 family)
VRSRNAVAISVRGESQFFTAVTGDISSGGVFVETDEVRPVGSRVLLMLSLPTGPVRTTGSVRWIRGATEGSSPGFGIAFDGLPSTKRHAIEAFNKTSSRPLP